jgi:biopolymer transport protein ExbD
MSKRRSLTEESDKVELNISPLIDMVFILLIFFIVTTVFVEEEGLDVNKPQPSSENLTENETLMFHITRNGEVYFENQKIGISGVRSTVRNRMQRENLPVILEVEADAPSGIMVRVMDEVKVANEDAAISINVAAEQ